jgi:hypothetical protein
LFLERAWRGTSSIFFETYLNWNTRDKQIVGWAVERERLTVCTLIKSGRFARLAASQSCRTSQIFLNKVAARRKKIIQAAI